MLSASFLKEFWDEKVAWKENGDITEDDEIVVRCKGIHYVIAPKDSVIAGFGGRKFVFQFTDGPHKGKTITSSNVWCQGRIPDEYRGILSDNAVMIQPEW
ncbi:hypothetical protein [Parageobacillus galactosidasius]|uniref:Uncharacterized protein n=1 Tax=Parageobacillus galactosidasius TaxID=883812 RepID=A0A226QT75_9BACL|nr:hypothetical protein [Parageobacillus galactosidasius]OXB94800.1 hypothetical protein B9L23_08030 [Parageobacillus galactosidasius]